MGTPPIPPEVVAWLESLVPDPCPRRDDTDREVWIRAGQVYLLRTVRAEFDRQQTNILTPR